MDSNSMKVEKKKTPILNWIMLILGVLLILPGGYFLVVFLTFLFSPALESTEGYLVVGLNCISGLVLLIGSLLVYFGIRRIRSQRNVRNENDL